MIRRYTIYIRVLIRREGEAWFGGGGVLIRPNQTNNCKIEKVNPEMRHPVKIEPGVFGFK